VIHCMYKMINPGRSFAILLLSCLGTKFCACSLQAVSTPPLLDSPVYALATLNKDGSTNMNIVTYATPVSIRPDRVWSLGIYKDTLTLDNLLRNPVCVLQLLTESQAKTVTVLGGSSGRDIDKREKCASLGFEWISLPDDFDVQVIGGCVHYLKLSIKGGLVDAGSHLIVPYCQVEEMYTEDDNIGVQLSTGKLRELGIINEAGRVTEIQN
jgi:flavin reductase (DIM6/NTAB) family NADH-FMN oxidoreductase RutF